MWRVFGLSTSSKTLLFKCLGGFSRHVVTAQEIRTFQEQGVVCLRGLFGQWVEKLKKGIATNHAHPSQFSEWLKSEDSQTFYFNDYFNWHQIPEFEEFVLSSPAAEIAGKLMASKVCLQSMLTSAHPLIVSPNAPQMTQERWQGMGAAGND